MAWVKKRLWFVLCISLVSVISTAGLECGYPGSPAFGRPLPIREFYRPGEAVTFACDRAGASLQGPLQRVCLENGTWAGPLPLCDHSVLGTEQHASSRATLALYPPEKAIDGSKETCSYTEKRKPRWFRVDLRTARPIVSVALTLPGNLYRSEPAQFSIYVISVKDSTTASYHKCAQFNGKFSSPTVKLTCAGGPVVGRYVHVEDSRNDLDYFGVCEIEVFVQRDSYECGEAERPAHAYTVPRESGVVEYRCVHGYRLDGPVVRQCLTTTGQWVGDQPLCKEIVCPRLNDVPHGRLIYGGGGRSGIMGPPVLGSTANVSCDYGYVPTGTEALRCMENGQWSGGTLGCTPVDCRVPVLPGLMDARHVLLNGTTLGSVALVFCEGERGPGRQGTPRICREDGTWSPLDADLCISNNMLAKLGLVDEAEATVPNGVVVGMAVVVFLLLLLTILLLLIKRKAMIRRNSAESLPSKSTGSTLTPSPSSVTDEKHYENDAFYATVPNEENKVNSKQHESDAYYASIAFDSPSDTSTESNKDTKSNTKSFLSTILFSRKKEQSQKEKENNPPLEAPKTTPEPIPEPSQPVYAQVDLDGKRKSRLARTLRERLDGEQRIDTIDTELDSEPVRLRELPPLPPSDDEDPSSRTYAALSLAPEPPPPLFRENMLNTSNFEEPYYETPPGNFSRTDSTKDTAIYST